jgi:hypothetical protein
MSTRFIARCILGVALMLSALGVASVTQASEPAPTNCIIIRTIPWEIIFCPAGS